MCLWGSTPFRTLDKLRFAFSDLLRPWPTLKPSAESGSFTSPLYYFISPLKRSSCIFCGVLFVEQFFPCIMSWHLYLAILLLSSSAISSSSSFTWSIDRRFSKSSITFLWKFMPRYSQLIMPSAPYNLLSVVVSTNDSIGEVSCSLAWPSVRPCYLTWA